jgi:hypothetical protein
MPGGLTVRLRVQGGPESVIAPVAGANCFPKWTGEPMAAIDVEIVWSSSFADHLLEKHWY